MAIRSARKMCEIQTVQSSFSFADRSMIFKPFSIKNLFLLKKWIVQNGAQYSSDDFINSLESLEFHHVAFIIWAVRSSEKCLKANPKWAYRRWNSIVIVFWLFSSLKWPLLWLCFASPLVSHAHRMNSYLRTRIEQNKKKRNENAQQWTWRDFFLSFNK